MGDFWKITSKSMQGAELDQFNVCHVWAPDIVIMYIWHCVELWTASGFLQVNPSGLLSIICNQPELLLPPLLKELIASNV